MISYQLVIGLEIHCKLKSQTGLFCACPNHQDFETLKPNTYICPVCTAQPGALPVLQKEPVDLAIKLAHCLTAIVHPSSCFDRKSYFYPDLPTGFQITQLYQPYCTDWYLKFYSEDYQTDYTIGIQEAHLEIDTGKTIHTESMELIDFNRSGTPLVEIVTNPDFRSADQVIAFLKELQRIVRYNNISDADLEKWHMRCDVNLSIMPVWSDTYGTRVEIKNINSYGNIRSAIEYEYKRQVQLLQSGQSIITETRARDASKNQTVSMRSKETINDYRYFPEPDLPPLRLDEDYINQLKSQIIELPYTTITRFKQDYEFHKEYINALIGDQKILDYFQDIVAQWYQAKTVAKRICWPICAWINEYNSSIHGLKFTKTDFCRFLDQIEHYKLSYTQAKMIMEQLINTGEKVDDIIHHLWFDQSIDVDYQNLAHQVIQDNPKVVQDYQSGKATAMAFLVGQLMKCSWGKADPHQARQILESQLL